MTVMGEAVVTPDVYRSAVRRLSRANFRRIRIAGGVLVVLGALLLFPELDAIPAGAAMVAVGFMFIFYVPYAALKKSLRVSAPALGEAWKYEFGDDALKVANPLATSEYRWSAFTSAEEFADFWLLRTALKNHAVVVVKRAFAPGDQLSLALTIQRHKLAESVAPAVS